MEIKNETKYTKDLTTRFQKMHYRKAYLPMQIACSVIVLIMAALLFIVNEIFRGCLVILFVLLFNLFMFILLRVGISRLNKSSRVINAEPIYEYTFTEDNISIIATSTAISSTQSIPYSSIFRVLISQSLTLIYISRIQAYIIDNTGFTQGTRDELIKLLEQKINMTRIKYSK